MVFIDEIKKSLKINREGTAKKVFVDTEDEESYSALVKMIEEAEEIAVPKAVVSQLDVSVISANETIINGILFISKILAENLKESAEAYGVVSTCGVEVEKWAVNYKNDPLLSYYADTIMLEVLAASVSYVNTYLSGCSKGMLSHADPGSTEDFPISDQAKLFEIIGNVKEKTGVFLTPEFLMKPLKSVSGIYFTSERHYSDCSICIMANCPNRQQPYNEEMYNRMFAKL